MFTAVDVGCFTLTALTYTMASHPEKMGDVIYYYYFIYYYIINKNIFSSITWYQP